jgi:hypothetical protein
MKMVRATLLIALTVGCGLGCGGGTAKSTDGGGGAGGKVASGTGPFLPLKVGNSWNYQVTDKDGDVSVKVQSVVAEETVGGSGPNSTKTAFRLVTGSKVNDPEGDVSWQGIVDERVVRYREQSIGGGSGKLKNEQYWDPARLRLDESAEHIAAGASWLEPEYTEWDVDVDTYKDGGTDGDGGTTFIPDGGVVVQDKIHDLWSVVSPSQQVTIPAGTYDALVVRRVGDSGASVKTFWFARGVGKIREAEEGKSTEELISVHIVP